ncbi:MAG: hypothetical protein CL917_06295 [Deltaproteobacteria bacterium]|nr:hypothetical protein [Deltaproteobacteria bacterium]
MTSWRILVLVFIAILLGVGAVWSLVSTDTGSPNQATSSSTRPKTEAASRDHIREDSRDALRDILRRADPEEGG